jgi:hypothetical protein
MFFKNFHLNVHSFDALFREWFNRMEKNNSYRQKLYKTPQIESSPTNIRICYFLVRVKK